MFCLRATNITKTFTHKKAVDTASLNIHSGHVYALLGENGAGKSTLASVLSGSLHSDSGKIEIGNSPFITESIKTKAVFFKNPKEAQDEGIIMVHQKPLLSDSLTVLENAILGDTKTTSFFSTKAIKKKLHSILLEWDIKLELHKKGKHLNGEESFYTELLSALYKKPKLLILDEPTALLPEKERKVFLEKLKVQAEKGLAILLITHNLQEALSYANYISVLKKGKIVLSKHNSQTNPIALFELEKALFSNSYTKDSLFSNKSKDRQSKRNQEKIRLSSRRKNREKSEKPKILFALNNLSFNGKQYPSLFNISFSVYEGSICYIYGQKASGIESLEEIITGIEKLHFEGSIFFDGMKTDKQLSPRILRKAGAAIISTNKNYRASNPALSILELLSVYKNVEKKAQDTEHFSKSLIEAESMQINIHEPVSALSGGMLQRLILERELSTDPKLLLFFEPSQGLDAQRLEQLARHLRSLSDMGKAILLVSANKEKEFSLIADDQYEMSGGKLI